MGTNNMDGMSVLIGKAEDFCIKTSFKNNHLRKFLALSVRNTRREKWTVLLELVKGMSDDIKWWVGFLKDKIVNYFGTIRQTKSKKGNLLVAQKVALAKEGQIPKTIQMNSAIAHA